MTWNDGLLVNRDTGKLESIWIDGLECCRFDPLPVLLEYAKKQEAEKKREQRKEMKDEK